MGFLNASSSFTRFRIADPVPATLWPTLPDKLKQFCFRDIDNTSDERSWGWVCFDDMLDTAWRTAPPEKGGYIAFSLRQDTRRIPAAVLKKHLSLALREEEARNKEQGKKFISRERKKELKEQTRLRLMSRFLPIPAEFNVLWAIDTGIIYFASTQSKMLDLFSDYFTLTFDLHLEPLTPYALAASMLDEAAMTRLDTLEPTRFAG
ncbi:recombination-associated protein RdgC [Nitratidesulfovibrio termitidis]|uniref:recombination-associated protein RdgC n=1 Tax=Nitratidesulfovibrio termitidis TaxID=42252 RepID=UPI000409ECC9|nr:recombination-associated protein RdgC [Nitratidesulfovibrio termitidis]